MGNNVRGNVPTRYGRLHFNVATMMMKTLVLFFACCLSLSVQAVQLQGKPAGKVDDALGRAGMAAVVLPAGESRPQNLLVVTGGANFPHAKPHATTPEERGEKVFYADVFVADNLGQAGNVKLTLVGIMPRPIAYAACAGTGKGMLVAGGCNAGGHVAKVTMSGLRDGEWVAETLPDLPRSVAYPAFALVGNKFYVMGGQEHADSTTALNSCYVLDLDNIGVGWQELSPMPDGRMLAAAGVVDGVIYVAGGCSLHPNAEGQAERTYLKDVLCYDPVSNTWAKVNAEMPETLVGMANPLPVVERKLYVIGGDPGNYYRASLQGKAPTKHPGQSRVIYTYEPSTGSWEKVGELSEGIATFPAVVVGNSIYTVSGEIFPGVRTPRIHVITPQ